MFSESFVSSLMQVAITGAGLVFAVYALVAALHRQMFRNRAKDLYEKVMEYKKQTGSTPTKNRADQRLQQLEADIRLTSAFPWYLDVGICVTFILYMASVLTASIWFVNIENRTGQLETAIWELFMCGNAAFLAVGFMIIVQISKTLRKAYRATKAKMTSFIEQTGQ
jgi:hypothetical protein